MVLDIQTLPTGHSVVSQTTALDAYKADLPPFSEKIVCEAAVDRTSEAVYVSLNFKGLFILECSRCCIRFPLPISSSLRLVVKEAPGRFGPSLDDESVDFYYDSRHLDVDLSPVIYEEIVTSLPMKPLCKEACEGIPLHDKNARIVNRRENKETDPRWEALKKLIKT